MAEPNRHGVYEPEATYEFARRGRAYALVRVARCRDGLFRFGVELSFREGGRSSPISGHGEGYPSALSAKDAGARAVLRCLPHWAGRPKAVRDELEALRHHVECAAKQPSLF